MSQGTEQCHEALTNSIQIIDGRSEVVTQEMTAPAPEASSATPGCEIEAAKASLKEFKSDCTAFTEACAPVEAYANARNQSRVRVR
jgi:hypothetical protein